MGKSDAECELLCDSEDEEWCPIPRVTRRAQILDISDSEKSSDQIRIVYKYTFTYLYIWKKRVKCVWKSWARTSAENGKDAVSENKAKGQVDSESEGQTEDREETSSQEHESKRQLLQIIFLWI